MKSFADWTDEIRGLMNPPAPEETFKGSLGVLNDVVIHDTCNMAEWKKRLEDWPRPIGFDLAYGTDFSASAIARKSDGRTRFDVLREEGLGAARRIGKTRMQMMLNEFYGRLAEQTHHVHWDKAYQDMMLTGHGVTKIIVDEFHDEVQIKHVPVDDLAKPLYVVGPQLKLAERWANNQGWLSGPFTYISRAEQLRGMARGTELVMMVNWHSNKSKAEVDEFCDLIAAYDLKVRFVQL